MGKKVGVLILHGVGVQKAGYSDHLQNGIKAKLKTLQVNLTDIEFNEVRYSDVFDHNQKERSNYLKNTSSAWQQITRGIRKLLIFVLSDAVSYRAQYKKVHQRISNHIHALKDQLEPHAPIVIAAHSMGAMAISDYLYDEQENKFPELNLAKISNLKALISFGCNIPLFEMGHDETVCIKRPESDKVAQQFFWTNFYSPFDVLGYRISKYYKRRPQPAFDIEDIKIFPGGLFRFWNIGSHTSYWWHDDIHSLLGKTIKKLTR